MYDTLHSSVLAPYESYGKPRPEKEHKQRRSIAIDHSTSQLSSIEALDSDCANHKNVTKSSEWFAQTIECMPVLIKALIRFVVNLGELP